MTVNAVAYSVDLPLNATVTFAELGRLFGVVQTIDVDETEVT